ncbi:LysR family transcriptional regulator [Undibacterium sp. Ji83W]|uniref:LysR family transcriptional regulator n=1 Tax=Undibacterium sp. Ji83W TaxID=3413043 RepID=UPI003BF34951
MNAKTQYRLNYRLTAADLEVVLALVRTGKLAEAGERLALDASTVFRSIQKLEKGLGQRLFERSRTGYQANELAQELAVHAEQMEAQLETARSAMQMQPDQVAGAVRITTTDTILHGLLAPVLKPLQLLHPLLSLDLHAGNELASLTRRDADIAIRASKRPPQHLIGRHLGPIRVALYAGKASKIKHFDADIALRHHWIAPDDALPEHPSVVWRKKHFPKLQATYKVNSILTVAELVGQGLGLGILPLFLAQGRKDMVQLSDVLDECQTELWLLTHTEARHLRRVSAVYSYLSQEMVLK